jgi:uncharacterized RDD family membrane protein YckC
VSEQSQSSYPGERLGLPADGPRSVASWGRRLAALFLDWIPSLLVANLVSQAAGLSRDQSAFLPLAVFALETTFFVAITGASFGQLAMQLRVARIDGHAVPLLRSLLRSVLVCLLVPPLVFNRDNRGLHDLAAGTVVIRR